MPNDRTGGQAFPVHNWIPQGGQQGYFAPQGGMSIRDFFAAAAMQGLLAGNPDGVVPMEFSVSAYQMADAMISEREKP